MNQIIHTAARRCSTRPALVSAIFKELDQILKNCVPQKSVFFAFDGPGPLAKLMTQRKRRMKDKTSHIASANVDQAKGVRTRNSKYAVKSIDRLELTPGCETLYYLRDAIEYWSHTRLQNDRKYRHVDIRISGADVPAEGELKIIDFCRSGGLLQKDSVIVVGGDADIVLQGLTTTSTQNFFVYLRKFGGNARKRTNYVVSVWELARSLERMFPGESNSVRLDFVLMSILNGNGTLLLLFHFVFGACIVL